MGIVGSRNWPNKAFVFEKIAEYLKMYPSIEKLVSGGQPKGVDGWAAEYVRTNDIPIIEHLPAHWYDTDDERYKPYHVRNSVIRRA